MRGDAKYAGGVTLKDVFRSYEMNVILTSSLVIKICIQRSSLFDLYIRIIKKYYANFQCAIFVF